MNHLTLVTSDDSADDEAIVARVLGGETSSFEVLIRRHNRRLFRTMRAILKSDDEAEDAMQEAYVSAFAHLNAFGGRARFSTWLVRIAVYEALGRLRRRKKAASLDEITLEQEPMSRTKNPEEETSNDQLRACLENAIDALPVGYRTVFVMRSVEGMSITETAESLDISEQMVRTRHHRARQLLQEELARGNDSIASDVFDFHLSRCDRVASNVLARISQTPWSQMDRSRREP